MAPSPPPSQPPPPPPSPPPPAPPSPSPSAYYKKPANYYRYYDTPDGCDMPKKMMVATRYGIIAGLVMSTFDILMYSHASGLSRILKRYAVHTVPLGLMGATFAGVANSAQHAREKDDVYNYFLGGFACGPVLAAYLGTKHAVLLGGLALGVIGMIKKDAVNHGYELFPDALPDRKSAWEWRMDYSLVKDPKIEMLKSCEIKCAEEKK